MKAYITLSLVAVCLTVLQISEVCGTEFSITLDADDKFNLTWSFDSAESSSDITFKIECETTGWVGIGLSPNGGMAGSDIVVGWVDQAEKAHIMDMHAVANSLPLVDNSQDVEIISGSEESGKTTLVFRRKINTCDQDDNIVTSSTTRLIFAYGSRDPTDNVLKSSDYHLGRRGTKSVYLLESEQVVQNDPEDAQYFDMVQDNYEIPEDGTTYYCKFFDPPALTTKHHIVAVEPIISPGNEGVVHHIVLYACWNVSQEHIRNNNKTEAACFSEEMPEFADSCRFTVHAWAVGGEKFYYPESVGLPLGVGDEEIPEYYMMETHYDNPQRVRGRLDSSGMRFTYTSELRADDVGTVTVGDLASIVVPPNQKEFRYISHCDSECTNQWIPEGGITMIAYMLHSHLLGAAIKVEWYRDGKEVGVLAYDDHYDFNYQEYRLLSPPQKAMPGDSMRITCTYNSENRNSMTYGGEGTNAEMCFVFLMYYPKQPITYCGSVAKYAYSNKSELYSRLSLNTNGFNGEEGLIRALDDVSEWTPEKVAIVQEFTEHEKRVGSCWNPGIKNSFENSWIDPADFPEIIPSKDGFCTGDDKDINDEVTGGGNRAFVGFISLGLVMIAVLQAL